MLNGIHVSFFNLNSMLVIIKESQTKNIFLQKVINQTGEYHNGAAITGTFYEQELQKKNI